MLTNGGRNMNEQQHQLSESNERLKKSLDECMGVIAKQQSVISNTIGYAYPTREMLEYALKTQATSTIDLIRAKKEFFDEHSN